MSTQNEVLAKVYTEAEKLLIRDGWTTGGAESTSRCVWAAAFDARRALPAEEQDLVRGFSIDPPLFEAVGVDYIDNLFALNDSKSKEEGLEWAIGVLHRAKELVTANAHSSDKTDTDSIDSTDTGNTQDVDDPAKQ